jgi:hypothetical protein
LTAPTPATRSVPQSVPADTHDITVTAEPGGFVHMTLETQTGPEEIGLSPRAVRQLAHNLLARLVDMDSDTGRVSPFALCEDFDPHPEVFGPAIGYHVVLYRRTPKGNRKALVNMDPEDVDIYARDLLAAAIEADEKTAQDDLEMLTEDED